MGGAWSRPWLPLVFDFVQDWKKIATAMHNPFDSDSVLSDAEEDHVITQCDQSRFRAEFGTQTINLRLFSYLLHPSSKQTKHFHRLTWAVLGNVVRDLFKIG